METTKRRFELIIRSFAAASPRSTRFASATSSAAVSSGQRPASFMKRVRLSIAPVTGAVARATGSACGVAISSTPRSSSSDRRADSSSSSSSCSWAYASSVSSSSSPSSSASSTKARGSSSASLVSSGQLLYFSRLERKGAGRGATSLTTLFAARVFLQQHLARLLMRKDLTLYPLQRIVNRLRVAVQLLGHFLVGRSLQIET